jgi:hypothetical protein
MKRSYFFVAGGAILFIVGAFAGKANSKFASIGIYFGTGGFCNKLDGTAPLGGTLVTAAPFVGACVAKITTKNCGGVNLYITSTCHNVAYLTH